MTIIVIRVPGKADLENLCITMNFAKNTPAGAEGGGDTKMLLSQEGLDAIERAAEKRRSADTLLLVQMLREVRELSALLKRQHHISCNISHNSSDGSCPWMM